MTLRRITPASAPMTRGAPAVGVGIDVHGPEDIGNRLVLFPGMGEHDSDLSARNFGGLGSLNFVCDGLALRQRAKGLRDQRRWRPRS